MDRYFSYENCPYPIRADIQKEHREYWQRLAQPGSWWSGPERVSIANESRVAVKCTLCKSRKSVLSPESVEGSHDSASQLPEVAVDAIHRIITDQTRISQSWVAKLPKNGLSTEAYVELAGIIVCVFSIDEFHRSLGLELEPLPVPVEGSPSQYRPAQAELGTGFVAMLPKEGLTGPERDLWPNGRSANVIRALSLVPPAVKDWLALSSAQYLSMEGMENLVKQDDRSINRMQMELIAARVSAINECFY
ncbi:MAG: hypothetical protein CMQ41_16545 [Gammaproteobacteria bacterium]|nr:hypothetical protein [Gammaproteobacteria bacterium]MBM89973.1 hypothetical protein [Gammaproteobacteria bacterium]|tara:strand:+ start:282 stop:1028 length:747 start_codon:yes stop_codon:yes gene_type:complete